MGYGESGGDRWGTGKVGAIQPLLPSGPLDDPQGQRSKKVSMTMSKIEVNFTW